MIITLKEPELKLEINKLDMLSETGWSVVMPDKRKILIRLEQGKWHTADNVSNQFVQALGEEIGRYIQAGEPAISNSLRKIKSKRVRILKYLPVKKFSNPVMGSFKIIIWIYDLPLSLLVTPLNEKFYRFKVQTINISSDVMILINLPDNSWKSEKRTMKFFTLDYINQLGKLIEAKKPEWFDKI